MPCWLKCIVSSTSYVNYWIYPFSYQAILRHWIVHMREIMTSHFKLSRLCKFKSPCHQPRHTFTLHKFLQLPALYYGVIVLPLLAHILSIPWCPFTVAISTPMFHASAHDWPSVDEVKHWQQQWPHAKCWCPYEPAMSLVDAMSCWHQSPVTLILDKLFKTPCNVSWWFYTAHYPALAIWIV